MERDEHREYRIVMHAIVDAHGPEEQAMGWYYYLEDEMTFPFEARCCMKRKTSALKVEECYEITGMADEEDCEHEMCVMLGVTKLDDCAAWRRIVGKFPDP